jgi:hypothetical protein
MYVQTLSLDAARSVVPNAQAGETICVDKQWNVVARSMDPAEVIPHSTVGTTSTFTVKAGQDVEGPWHKIRG